MKGGIGTLGRSIIEQRKNRISLREKVIDALRDEKVKDLTTYELADSIAVLDKNFDVYEEEVLFRVADRLGLK